VGLRVNDRAGGGLRCGFLDVVDSVFDGERYEWRVADGVGARLL
jgi:hypothetical protein